MTAQDDTTGGSDPRGLMSSACAGMFIFGVVMAILGAILPTLFDTIQLDKSQAGNLFLFFFPGCRRRKRYSLKKMVSSTRKGTF